MTMERMCGAVIVRAAVAALALMGVSLLLYRPAEGQESDEGLSAALPDGVRAVWDLDQACHETTPTRERISINGLWRWQPSGVKGDQLPTGNWGYFKVPGCWPGITDYLQKDCQTVYPHRSWKGVELRGVRAAWYQREIVVPAGWTGRRFAVWAEYLNSYAAIFVDGRKAGEMRFPAGEVDVTSICRPGGKYVLSMYVVAMPLKSVMLSFSDTASSKEAAGSVERRGLCGDVYLVGRPAGACIADVKVDTSVRNEEIAFSVAFRDLDPGTRYTLRAEVSDRERSVAAFTSNPFETRELRNGRMAFSEKWKAEKLWDIHTPHNQYQASVSLLDSDGTAMDISHPTAFGFRELWIDGRDFFLNGTRIFLSALPLDNAQVGAALACYDGAKESLLRLKSIGINFVYTHNYGCEPGTHLGFSEILKAADDVGMLVSFSQPHFGQYDWQAPDADKNNGYAGHAAFYVSAAGNHPSVVMYSMSHNATGYAEDMNPDMIDGITEPRDSWALNNAKRALRAEAIVRSLDPARIVYHHSSGNLSSMHTVNFYTNMAPAQELDDWFEHWATKGVKPMFTCEYMVPCTWDWTMYRGWYKGGRSFGSATVPWEYCIAEWSSQFLGDRAYRISDQEKENIRWEAAQFRAGKLWHRWDYPWQVGSRVFEDQHTIIGTYLAGNWRSFRTWGVSAISPWEHDFFWSPRAGVSRSRRELKVDWDNLQRPGFSADYIDRRYERMDLAFDRSDWIPTADGQAILRNNMPLLAYIAGKPDAFTGKDHIFTPGQTVEKQLILINNSRESVTCGCRWSFGLPRPEAGSRDVTIPTGQQQRIPVRADLPPELAPGRYDLSATFRFSDGQTQTDSFTLHILPRPEPLRPEARIALFDPRGETARLLAGMGVRCQAVEATTDVSGFDLLVVGKGALAPDGPAPDVSRVRDGLKVLLFEQTSEVLEQRFGFRVTEYGLRQVFKRVPDHPLLAGVDVEHLRDWRGEATLLPPRLTYQLSPRFSYAPTITWCDIEVSHVWRCGNRGNVASVLIEKPARGDFLPILDGGYSLQYSPLMECREGKGTILLCQMDVTGRTEDDPAAARLVRNILAYASATSDRQPTPRREAVYVGEPAGRRHLMFAGIAASSYDGGKLSPDRVLIAGTGAGEKLAANAPAIAGFLEAGGHLLALGLDDREANAFLPFKIRTTKAEHIASYFEPPPAGSLLAGVAPADVHNRDPRQLPLVSSGAATAGDGVLAQNGNVVFCQLPPYTLTASQGVVPSFVVNAEDPFEGQQSALVTLGMTAGAGVQFGQKPDVRPKVGTTYSFAVFVKSLEGPILAHLEVERAGSPWDRAVKGDNVLVPEGQWTELHVTFRCEKPFPEGWQAYIGCAQDGGRFRADLFRLYEGDYVPWKTAKQEAETKQEAEPRNFFINPGFEKGQKPWFFSFHEQLNLRRTFRRTSFLLTRLLANMGVRAETPLLSRFSIPVGGDRPKPGPSVVRNGDFSQAALPEGIADQWQFSSDSNQATCARERTSAGGAWMLRLAMPGYGGKDEASAMLSQNDVPVKEGQWYLISLRARAEGLAGKAVTLTIQNTQTWTSFFDYQSFAPREDWSTFQFLVQSNATAGSKTRFQIWHGNIGILWLSDIAMTPVAPPSREARWSQGLYLDQPEEWDDPYRFFRW